MAKTSKQKQVTALRRRVNELSPGEFDDVYFKPRNKHFTDSQIEDIECMRNAGLNPQQIAEVMCCREDEVTYTFQGLDNTLVI